MAITSFIPTVWSAQVLARLKDALVFANVANTDYEGEISEYGDTVKINEIGPITIRDYTRNSTGENTREYLTDAQKELKIDNAKYFDFEVDDLDAVQATGNYMARAMEEAGWGFGNVVDEQVASLGANAGINVGSTGSAKDITSSNVVSWISYTSQQMDEANVPEMGRWAVVAPWFAHKMTLARIQMDTNNSGIITSGRGYLGGFYGFQFFKSNNVISTAGANTQNLFGYSGTISLATQLKKVEAFRSQKTFADEVRGLVLWGSKVVRPDSLARLWADETDEAT